MKKRISNSCLVFLLQLLAGLTLMLTSFAKIIDPVENLYSMSDALAGSPLSLLQPIALPCLIMLWAAQFAVGYAYIWGIWYKGATLAAKCILGALTLHSAIATACDPMGASNLLGCMCQVPNWAATATYAALLGMTLLICMYCDFASSGFFIQKGETSHVVYAFVLQTALSAFCYHNLPALDFSDFAIEAKMEDARQHSSFAFTHPTQGDVTDRILTDTGYTFLLVAPNLGKHSFFTNQTGARYKYAGNANSVYEKAKAQGINFYCLTATEHGSTDMKQWQEETNARYEYLHTSETTLRQMVKSSPGLLLLKNGTVVNKWPAKKIPAYMNTAVFEQEGANKPWKSAFRIVYMLILLLVPMAFRIVSDNSTIHWQ